MGNNKLLITSIAKHEQVLYDDITLPILKNSIFGVAARWLWSSNYN